MQAADLVMPSCVGVRLVKQTTDAINELLIKTVEEHAEDLTVIIITCDLTESILHATNDMSDPLDHVIQIAA
jgi:hypothetical protein